ncbi:hypothetical protein NHX12_029061, partial [Muraenolepis orangiensis]
MGLSECGCARGGLPSQAAHSPVCPGTPVVPPPSSPGKPPPCPPRHQDSSQ